MNGTFIGWLPAGDLPQDYRVAENIGLLRVVGFTDDLWCHPLICADLVGHVLIEGFRPTEIGDADMQVIVKQDIQAFQIAMKDGWVEHVQVVHSSSNF